MRTKTSAAMTICCAILVGSSPDAGAQGGPIDIQQFKPAMDSKGHFNVDSTQVLSPWNTSIGLLVNYAYRPLVLKGPNDRTFRVNDLVGANIQFAIGMFKLSRRGKPWFEIGIGIPVTFYNAEINPSPFGLAQGEGGCTGSMGCTVWAQDSINKEKYPLSYGGDGKTTAQGLGDIYLHMKFRFMDTSTSPVGLGALLSLYFPSSMVQNGHMRMIGSGAVTIAPKLILDKVWRKSGVLLSVNLGTRIRVSIGDDNKLELRENPGWYGCQWQDLQTTGQELPVQNPCGASNASYGFAEDRPDNGLSMRLKWKYEITYGLGISWRIVEAVAWVTELVGSLELSSLAAKNETVNLPAGSFLGPSYEAEYYKRVFPLELLTGFKFYLAASSFFAVGAGVGLTGVGPLDAVGAPDFRVFASFVFEPTVGDRDGDGIKDDVDKCPDQPEDFDDFEDKDGCPEPDNDDDGIPDVDDKCPNTPENFNGYQDEDGCPDKKDEDRDGDGIPDSRDKCPDVPEDKDGFEDQDGCPDPDNDGDSVPDSDDSCPGYDADKKDSFAKTKEDMDGFEDNDGCPDPDNDKDGILDKDDKCPNQPETFNDHLDDDGCPDKKPPVTVGPDKLVIFGKIHFKTNSATIRRVSYPILKAVAETLQQHPELKRIEVQGHTDERGSRRYNLRLSRRRAAAVRLHLINRGVNSRRLISNGYGEDRPKCHESTPACWSTNRRSEFVIVKKK